MYVFPHLRLDPAWFGAIKLNVFRCLRPMSFVADFQRELKRQSARGRCLHYEMGGRCNEIISAHSIQRSGQLAHIVEDGHVYRVSADLSTLNKNNGKPKPRRVGVNRVSTFAGFCKRHDNALFAPIDDYPLRPDAKQVALYAYRSLCREYFVKENAVRSLSNPVDHCDLDPSARSRLAASCKGHAIGFNGLQYHKEKYDRALLSKSYRDFDYAIFTSNSPCAVQLSGLLYPDYDFTGRCLQELGLEERPLELITFFTAPTASGWSLGFAWHVSSSSTCERLLGSLAAVVSSGTRLEDALLRFSVSCCENHALRMSWWDALPPHSKATLMERISLMGCPFTPVPSSYLAKGCEGIANWSFEHVYTTLPARA